MFRRDHRAHESVLRSSSTTLLAHLILVSVKEYLCASDGMRIYPKANGFCSVANTNHTFSKIKVQHL